MTQENKNISRRLIEEVYNKGNLSAIDEMLSSDYVNHSAPPGLTNDSAGLKDFATMYRTAFPDLHIEIEDMISEGEEVVTRWTATGTHQGELMGIPATNRKVTVTGLAMNRLAGGKIVEAWNEFDTSSMLAQLGVNPIPDK